MRNTACPQVTSRSFISLILLTLVTANLPGCVGNDVPEIQAGVDACRHCRMVISQANQAAAYTRDGEFHTFCNPLCLLKDLEKQKEAAAKVEDLMKERTLTEALHERW